MKRTILASVTAGLAALMTFGCGNVVGTTTGQQNNSEQPFAGPPGAPQTVRIFAIDVLGNLLLFSTDNPLILTSKVTPTGLPAGERLIAIDFRPNTGLLYGITTTGKVFYVDTVTAQCSQIGAGVSPSQAAADIDFNPTVDRIRQVAGTQNIRVNPNTGVLAATDTNLSINGVANSGNGVACAYTNSFAGATSTQLFTVDAVAQQVFLQDPANGGTLTLGVNFPFAFGNNVGFDIGPNNQGWIAVAPAGSGTSKLFTFDPVSRTLIPQTDIGGGQVIKSIAVEIGAPASTNFVGIDEAKNLVRFNSGSPQSLASTTPITGLAAGDVVRGCDFRPGTGAFTAANALHVLTVAAGGASKLFQVDINTGAATLLAPLSGAIADVGTFTGIDFNPTNDLLRIVNGTGANFDELNGTHSTVNFSVTPGTGATVNQGFLSYAALDFSDGFRPLVTAAAYSQNFAGSQSTGLFVVDAFRDTLCRQNPPNSGVLTTIGGLSVDTTSQCGLDIEASDRAWFVFQPRTVVPGVITPPVPPATTPTQGPPTIGGGTKSILCRLNLQTGQASPVAQIGGGVLVDFSVVPPGL